MSMKHLANITQLGIKELRSLGHDAILLFLILWSFSGGIYAGATAASQELHNAPIAVVDEDQSPLSARIISAFYGPYFKPPRMISMEEVDPGLDAGDYTFVLDIPPDFERDVLAGKQPAVQVNIDATQMKQAFIGSNYIRSIATGEINEFVQRHRTEAVLPITLTTRVKFNPNLNGIWFGGVMQIISKVTMLSIILAGAALIREREHGTLEHLLVMPLTPLRDYDGQGMGERPRGARLYRPILAVYGAGSFGRPHSWLHPLIPARRCAPPVLHDLDGHPPGHDRALHAAVWAAHDSCRPHVEYVVRRHHAAREHAGDRADHHARGADHAFHRFGTGDSVPRRQLRRGLAPICGHYRHWDRVFHGRVGALPGEPCRPKLKGSASVPCAAWG